ncbi:MAG: hypothetical protein A2Z47_11130 [Thermodesulfovibrio sp. RBG_19FT_COMBO_42_12]|nr:MAG: hypothetical protein A2Z47_11130 [Thermodesulfovibrio sp. RBG_19FT_COMBO_42_12]
MNLSDDKNIWFFQANPKRYKIIEALSDPNYQKTTWQTTRYKKDIKKGDFVLIWVAGKKAGIYATAWIIENPIDRFPYPPGPKYWVNPENEALKKAAFRAMLEIDHNFVDNPIPREALKVMGITGSLICAPYQGTNFRVKPKDWDIIKGLL